MRDRVDFDGCFVQNLGHIDNDTVPGSAHITIAVRIPAVLAMDLGWTEEIGVPQEITFYTPQLEEPTLTSKLVTAQRFAAGAFEHLMKKQVPVAEALHCMPMGAYIECMRTLSLEKIGELAMDLGRTNIPLYDKFVGTLVSLAKVYWPTQAARVLGVVEATRQARELIADENTPKGIPAAVFKTPVDPPVLPGGGGRGA